MLEEALQICRAMFTEETPSFSGEHYRIENAYNLPRPLRGDIPILVGGGGEKRTLRLVAQYADACNVHGDPDMIRHKMAVIDRHCADVGRDPSEVRRTWGGTLFLTETAEEAAGIEGLLRPAAGDEYDHNFIVGDEAVVVDKVAALIDAGIELDVKADSSSEEELLKGGSIYWVIKGQIAVRQRLRELRAVTRDGVPHCALVLDEKLVPVERRGHRAFQGWRYLQDHEKPQDIGKGRGGLAKMPETLRRELAEARERAQGIRLAWEGEKAAIAGVRETKSAIEEAQVRIDQARREFDYEKAAEIQYGTLPELQRRLAEQEADRERHGRAHRVFRPPAHIDQAAQHRAIAAGGSCGAIAGPALTATSTSTLK